jgi:hypothetical protein
MKFGGLGPQKTKGDGRWLAHRAPRRPFGGGRPTSSNAKYQDAAEEKTGHAGNQAQHGRQDEAVPFVWEVVPERMGGRACLQEVQVDRSLADRLIQ